MPQFSRNTKTRVCGMDATQPVVEYFTAHPAKDGCKDTPALKIAWRADDGKDYSLCLYGEEMTKFNLQLISGLAQYHRTLSDEAFKQLLKKSQL